MHDVSTKDRKRLIVRVEVWDRERGCEITAWKVFTEAQLHNSGIYEGVSRGAAECLRHLEKEGKVEV